MSGFFDFLTGLLNPTANAAAQGAMPQPGGGGGFFNGIQQGFNDFGKQLGGLFGQNQAPSVPQYYKDANPGAGAQGANPASLGMVNDPSNPMNNDMMRKMMMAQFMAKQGQQQQAGAPAALPMIGGGGGRPGMGNGMGNPGQLLNSMPPQLPNRKQFLGGGSGMGY